MHSHVQVVRIASLLFSLSHLRSLGRTVSKTSNKLHRKGDALIARETAQHSSIRCRHGQVLAGTPCNSKRHASQTYAIRQSSPIQHKLDAAGTVQQAATIGTTEKAKTTLMACSIHTMPTDNGRSEKATSRSTWASLAYPLRNLHQRFQFVSPRLVRFSDSRMAVYSMQAKSP